MSENLSIWEALEVTEPKYTKSFNRSGFAGTATNPTYLARKLTDALGPNGQGWRLVIEEENWFQSGIELMIRADGTALYQMVHFVRAHIEWKDPVAGTVHMTSPVYGATPIYMVRRDGTVMVDEEAPKKSLTDAFSKAAVLLGAAADVHMGLYDDVKYVQSLLAEDPPQPVEVRPRPAHTPKKNESAVEDPAFVVSSPVLNDAPDMTADVVDHVSDGLPVFKDFDDRMSDEMRERGIATIEEVFIRFVDTIDEDEKMRAFWRMNRNAIGYVKNAAPDAYERILKAFTTHSHELQGK